MDRYQNKTNLFQISPDAWELSSMSTPINHINICKTYSIISSLQWTHSLQTLAVPNIGWCVCAIIPNDIDPPQSNSNTNWKLMSKSHCHLSVASSPMFLTKRPSHKGNSELTKEIHIRCLGAYFVSWFSSEGMILTVVSTVMLLYVKRLVLSHETKMKRAITKFGQKFMIAASYKRIYL